MKNAQKGSLRIGAIWLLLILGAWGAFALAGWCTAQALKATIAATRTQ